MAVSFGDLLEGAAIGTVSLVLSDPIYIYIFTVTYIASLVHSSPNENGQPLEIP